MGHGYGFTPWGWLVMSMFWIALIAAIVWAVARLFPSGSGRPPAQQETPGEVLDRRLATGEIDLETYRALRAELEANRQVR